MDSPSPNHFKLLSIWVRGHRTHRGRLIKRGLPEVITFFRAVFKRGEFLMRQGWFAVISEGGETGRSHFSLSLCFLGFHISPARSVTAKRPLPWRQHPTTSTLKHIFLLYLFPCISPKLFWVSSDFPWQLWEICTALSNRKAHSLGEEEDVEEKLLWAVRNLDKNYLKGNGVVHEHMNNPTQWIRHIREHCHHFSKCVLWLVQLILFPFVYSFEY